MTSNSLPRLGAEGAPRSHFLTLIMVLGFLSDPSMLMEMKVSGNAMLSFLSQHSACLAHRASCSHPGLGFLQSASLSTSTCMKRGGGHTVLFPAVYIWHLWVSPAVHIWHLWISLDLIMSSSPIKSQISTVWNSIYGSQLFSRLPREAKKKVKIGHKEQEMPEQTWMGCG